MRGARINLQRLVIVCLVGVTSTLALSAAVKADNGQLGDDINGVTAFGQFGAGLSLSADGSTLVIGAPIENVVRAYRWSGTAWAQLGNDIAGTAGDLFGYSVAVSSNGNTIAVGAPENDAGAADAGRVRVFDLTGGNWVPRGTAIDGGAASDRLGWSVAVSANGNDIVVGATQDKSPDPGGTGFVAAYRWNGAAWMLRGAPISGVNADDRAGWSVDISDDGETIAFGAILHGQGGGSLGSGRVRVLSWNGNAWSQVGGNIDGSPDDQSGFAVSLSADGTVIAIGAPSHNGTTGAMSGTTRVYALSGGTWTQRGSKIDGRAAGDQSGSDVALSDQGDTLVVGAQWYNGQVGEARVFTFAGGSWLPRGNPVVGRALGYIGSDVAISGNGTIFAVGAFSFGNLTGQVRAFQWVPPPAAPQPFVSLWRATLHPAGGTCIDNTPRTETWTSAFVGYRYLPGPTDCTRPGHVFGGWANTTTPTVARTFPLLDDPSSNTQRYFIAENATLAAIWKPLPKAVSELVVFANFLCGPCTNAWLIHWPSEHASSYDYTLNAAPATCAPKLTILGFHACQLTGLTSGTPLTATVTPRNTDGVGPNTTTTFTLRTRP
ncbi:MAG: hypothetical protein ACKOJC_01885 [Actinomycetota bacterium]